MWGEKYERQDIHSLLQMHATRQNFEREIRSETISRKSDDERSILLSPGLWLTPINHDEPSLLHRNALFLENTRGELEVEAEQTRWRVAGHSGGGCARARMYLSGYARVCLKQFYGKGSTTHASLFNVGPARGIRMLHGVFSGSTRWIHADRSSWIACDPWIGWIAFPGHPVLDRRHPVSVNPVFNQFLRVFQICIYFFYLIVSFYSSISWFFYIYIFGSLIVIGFFFGKVFVRISFAFVPFPFLLLFTGEEVTIIFNRFLIPIR